MIEALQHVRPGIDEKGQTPPSSTCSKTMPSRGNTTPKVSPSSDSGDQDLGFPPEYLAGKRENHNDDTFDKVTTPAGTAVVSPD